MLCKCTMILYSNVSLCKKGRHYFRHGLVLFTFHSKLSFLFHYVILPKWEVLVDLCVSTVMKWPEEVRVWLCQPLLTPDSVDSVWMVTNWARYDLPKFLETYLSYVLCSFNFSLASWWLADLWQLLILLGEAFNPVESTNLSHESHFAFCFWESDLVLQQSTKL